MSFPMSRRSHRNLFLSKSQHGRRQDFNEKEERAETSRSEYSCYNFRSGELICSGKPASPGPRHHTHTHTHGTSEH